MHKLYQISFFSTSDGVVAADGDLEWVLLQAKNALDGKLWKDLEKVEIRCLGEYEEKPEFPEGEFPNSSDL